MDVLPPRLLPDLSRLGRRERTRRELLQAGVELIAAGRTDVAVLEITRTAGVGQGTFYNHFADKNSFFRDSLEHAVDLLADMIEELVEPASAAEECVQSFRAISRVHRLLPALSLAVIRRGSEFYGNDSTLVRRVRRDLENGVESGEFHVRDVEGATGTVLGGMLMLGQRIHNDPALDVVDVTDAVAGDILQLLGVHADRIEELLRIPWIELEL